jgi:hypothetical protein
MDDTIRFLKATLPLVWCRDTAALSVQGFWSDLNPALGQSDVTALLVHCLCGGEIIRTMVQGFGAHYYNRLPDGTEVDLTDMQYPERTEIPRGTPVGLADLLDGYIAKRLQIHARYRLLSDRYEAQVLAPEIEPDSDS